MSVAQSIAADVASSYAHTKRKSIVAMEKAKSDSISAMEKAKADSLRSIEDAKAKVSDGVKSWTPFGGGDDEVTIEEERSEVETNLSKPVDSSVATNQASRGIRVHGFRNGATDETEPETYSPTVEETPKKDERNKVRSSRPGDYMKDSKAHGYCTHHSFSTLGHCILGYYYSLSKISLYGRR